MLTNIRRRKYERNSELVIRHSFDHVFSLFVFKNFARFSLTVHFVGFISIASVRLYWISLLVFVPTSIFFLSRALSFVRSMQIAHSLSVSHPPVALFHRFVGFFVGFNLFDFCSYSVRSFEALNKNMTKPEEQKIIEIRTHSNNIYEYLHFRTLRMDWNKNLCENYMRTVLLFFFLRCRMRPFHLMAIRFA